MGRFRDSFGMWLAGLSLLGGVIYSLTYVFTGLPRIAYALHQSVPILSVWMTPYSLLGLPFIILFCVGLMLMRDKK
jgi:hypothetical protein